jgi:hypothetical protein
MKELLHHLIEALREELKQYGEMLALLEHQQEVASSRHEASQRQSAAAVDAQAEVLRAARCEREQRRLDLARALNLDEGTSFRGLSGRVPAQYQPLLEALVEENQRLLQRIHQRTRQNHLLLHRALKSGQRPGGGVRRSRPASALAPRSFYEALG